MGIWEIDNHICRQILHFKIFVNRRVTSHGSQVHLLIFTCTTRRLQEPMCCHPFVTKETCQKTYRLAICSETHRMIFSVTFLQQEITQNLLQHWRRLELTISKRDPNALKRCSTSEIKEKLRNTIFHDRWKEFPADVNKNCIPSKCFIFQENDFQSSQKMRGQELHRWLIWRLVSQTQLSINDVNKLIFFSSLQILLGEKWMQLRSEGFTSGGSVLHCRIFCFIGANSDLCTTPSSKIPTKLD